MTEAKTASVFSCHQCGQCCQGWGGVCLNPFQVRQAAEYLQLSVIEFTELYLESGPPPQDIRLGLDGFCIFHRLDGSCHIHPVKPSICGQWPFLPGILKHESAFLEAKAACPGLNSNLSWATFKEAEPPNSPDYVAS